MEKDKRDRSESQTEAHATRGPKIKLPREEWGLVHRVIADLRRRVLIGALLVIPIVIAFLPVYFIYPTLQTFAVEVLGIKIPGVGFIASLLLIILILYLVGLFSASFLVRRTAGLGERILHQIPIVNFLYRTTKQVTDIIQATDAREFTKPVLIEYPRKGIYAMGFVTGEAQYAGTLGHQVHIFVPTTPNPTSGFLLLFSPDQVLETGLSIDEAVRFIISGGILDMGALAIGPYQSAGVDPEGTTIEGLEEKDGS
ncbi:DUF502 domain-containing protein [Candidatus Sumerlaeota bacterium]|nr:DUF502 domain-containing protein [Candidatus Sumerlaeota bacterium]